MSAYSEYDFASYARAYEASRFGSTLDLNDFPEGNGVAAARDAKNDALAQAHRLGENIVLQVIERRPPSYSYSRPEALPPRRWPVAVVSAALGVAVTLLVPHFTHHKDPEDPYVPDDSCNSLAHSTSIPAGKIETKSTKHGTIATVIKSTNSDEPIRMIGNIHAVIPKGTHVESLSLCSDTATDQAPKITLEEGATAKYLDIQGSKGLIAIKRGTVFDRVSTNGEKSQVIIPESLYRPEQVGAYGEGSRVVITKG